VNKKRAERGLSQLQVLRVISFLCPAIVLQQHFEILSSFLCTVSLLPISMSVWQGSFFGVRIRFLASEGGSLHKYTNQSQSLRILQPEKRTLLYGG
jgi:hypothetical protein